MPPANRYLREKSRLELALRLIGHEARTGTIRRFTGFSDDRVRKLFDNYFRDQPRRVKRRRGKTPTQIFPLVKNSEIRLESTYLVAMMGLCGAWTEGSAAPDGGSLSLDLGHRLCQAYENYLCLVPDPSLSFESAWSLYLNLMQGEDLGVDHCPGCNRWYLFDALSLAGRECPICDVLDRLTAP